jgi:Ca2+-binding EF-hand superfamily protein
LYVYQRKQPPETKNIEVMSTSGVANSLPKVPGYDFSELNQSASFAKSQGFGFNGGVASVKQIQSQSLAGIAGPTSSAASLATIKSCFPHWKTLDGKVLRFYGWFNEKVTESRHEVQRLRKVTVNFYLADQTVSLSETAVSQNHGMRTGKFMSRHVEAALSVKTLRVGETYNLRARSITLVDADAFTRDFYQTIGTPLTAAAEYPGDSFAALHLASKAQKPRTDDDIALKQSMEQRAAIASGHAMTTLTPAQRVHAQQFLKHDREVLNFFATWNDRHFRISFYLADGTLSVNFLKAPNDGRDPVANFVKRGLIPKGSVVMKSIDTIAASRSTTAEYFGEQDLATGNTVSMYGRDFAIYDCDEYTREHYQNAYGIAMGPVAKGFTEGDAPTEKRRVAEIPPYNGFGTEEDSLGSFRHMVPKPPKKDLVKFIKHSNDVLRFATEMADPLPEDVGRKFIMCFYLADDTVGVYEYAVRNTGHTGGKTFARAKVPSVTPEGMVVGNVITLGGQGFLLKSVDDRTKRFLETGESMGGLRDSKAEDLLARVRLSLTQKFSRVTDAYRHFAGGKSGFCFAELQRMFRECEVKVENDETLATVMQLVDQDEDGVISLQEFVENVLRQSLVAAAPSAASSVPAGSYLAAQKEREKQDFANKVLKTFVAKLEARRAYIVDAFRIVSDRSVDGLIGVDTFRHVVTDRLGLIFTDAELDALVYRFFYVENMPDYHQRRLTLRDFRKVLER